MVSDIPSDKIFIPLIPKEERNPLPLIDNLVSWAKLYSPRAKIPGIFFILLFIDIPEVVISKSSFDIATPDKMEYNLFLTPVT